MASQNETQEDFGKEPAGVVRRWKLELEYSDSQEKAWRKDAERVISRYRGEEYRTDSHDGGTRIKNNAFNILWSNTETLRPALYNSTPRPRVRRRFRQEDDIGKAVSEVLERALSYMVDSYDFDRTMGLALDDYLLPGRGVTRVRYVPTVEGSEGSEGEEELAYEEAVCEHVNWMDFRRGPGRTWDEVPWIAFRHRLTREQLVEKFGDDGKKVKLNLSIREDDEDKQDEDDQKRVFDRAEIWEIWDKEKKQVLFIHKDEREPLKVADDPLSLEGFFPIPRPLYSMESSTSLVPVPEYLLYETLARELDRVTSRIMKILEGLRLRGIYDSTLSELSRLYDAGDNQMIPAENMAKLYGQTRGLDDAVWMLPVDTYAEVLRHLYDYRSALIQSIYEVTGISDILRGRSERNETATAQQIKSNWGTLRIQRRQREIQRYARDLIRIKAEVIAENFDIETLKTMTGLQYPTNEEKKQAMSTMQAVKQRMAELSRMNPGREVKLPDAMQKGLEAAERILNTPSWEQIKETMQNDLLRGYKVEIETDSTIAEQMTEEKQDVVDMLNGLVEFSNGVGPAMQQGLLPPKALKSLLLATVRRFKLGEEVEDAIEEAEIQQGEGPSPEEVEAQVKMQEMEHEKQKMQFEAKKMERQHQFDMQRMEREMEKERLEHAAEMQEIRAKTQGKVQEQAAQAEHDVIKSEVESDAA